MATTDLTIVIVSFNTRELTLECLRSVFQETRELTFEVIVLDNASTDGSADAIAEAFPQVRLIRSLENLGFARANNVAAEYAQGQWLLLLNPDTVVLDGAIDKLVAFAESHPEAGVFGGRTLFPDGSLNPSSCWGRMTTWSALCGGLGLSYLLKGNHWVDPEALGQWKRDTVREVDIVTGCFFLLHRDLWECLGGFDPAFFMYGEETDLCLRAHKVGVRCLICPEAAIIHYGGASERVRADKMVRLFHAKARLFRKHWSAPLARFGVFTLDLWAITRLAAFTAGCLICPRCASSRATWRAIWSRRSEWHDTASPGEDLSADYLGVQ